MDNRSRNILIVIFVAIAVVLTLVFVLKGEKRITNMDSEGSTIVAFGDSLVQGVGSTDGNDFVSVLSIRIGRPIINLGVSGNTTADGLSRIDSALKQDPKIVILLLGGNDYLKKVPIDQTFDNLQRIVMAIHSKGSMVILLGVRGGLLKDNFEDRFKDFAKRNNVAFVPDVLDGIIYNKEFLSDSIHPNDIGYKMIADRVEPVLRELLF